MLYEYGRFGGATSAAPPSQNESLISSPVDPDTVSAGSFHIPPPSPTPQTETGSLPAPTFATSTPREKSSVTTSCNGLNNGDTMERQLHIQLSKNNNNIEDVDGIKPLITNGNVVNGNFCGIDGSSQSVDVLSGGESDADTLRRNHTLGVNASMSRSSATAGGRRRAPGGHAYYAAKELLMTERTYKKDLEVITLWWSQYLSEEVDEGLVSGEEAEALGRPCLAMEPLAVAQGALLAALDARLASAEGKAHARPDLPQDGSMHYQVGDILCDHLNECADIYMDYATRASGMTARLEAARRRRAGPAERAVAAFGAAHSLPLHIYLLRPLHRLLYYNEVLHKLHEMEGDWDCSEQGVGLTAASELAREACEQLLHAENHAHLCHLQRDIIGYDNLLVPGREFVRHGCLHRHPSKGPQPRMVFLFSDMLMWAGRGGSCPQFRVRGVLPLAGLEVYEAPLEDVPHSFTVKGEGRVLQWSASSAREAESWLADLRGSATRAADAPVAQRPLPPQAEAGSTEDLNENNHENSPLVQGNSLVQVCWHRNTSLSRLQLHLACKSQISGYLLRKFKNSHGWQKLWVEFAVFTLYFYKSWQDHAALASLPLLGYNVSAPSEQDGIHKDFVMKLLFKNHVYFFRAESEYTYNRWMDVISTATNQTITVQLEA